MSSTNEHHTLVTLSKDGLKLKSFEVQTYEMCYTAVGQNGNALEFVFDQTPALILRAVTENGLALKHAVFQSNAIVEAAIKSNPLSLQYVINKSLNIVTMALKLNGLAIQFVPDISAIYEMFCKIALNQNEKAINHIILSSPYVSPAIRMLAVKKDGLLLSKIVGYYQTYEITYEAVKQNGLALQFVDLQTPAIVRAAIHQNEGARIYSLLAPEELLPLRSKVMRAKVVQN